MPHTPEGGITEQSKANHHASPVRRPSEIIMALSTQDDLAVHTHAHHNKHRFGIITNQQSRKTTCCHVAVWKTMANQFPLVQPAILRLPTRLCSAGHWPSSYWEICQKMRNNYTSTSVACKIFLDLNPFELPSSRVGAVVDSKQLEGGFSPLMWKGRHYWDDDEGDAAIPLPFLSLPSLWSDLTDWHWEERREGVDDWDPSSPWGFPWR